MKRAIIFPIFALLLMIGCAGLRGAIYDAMTQGEQAEHYGVRIYKGQSGDSVERALGPPDVVSSGCFCKNASNLPFGTNPGRNTIEWVFTGPVYSTLVYLDHGRVSFVHQIPTSKVRR